MWTTPNLSPVGRLTAGPAKYGMIGMEGHVTDSPHRCQPSEQNKKTYILTYIPCLNSLDYVLDGFVYQKKILHFQ